MRLIRGLAALQPQHQHNAVTIGNFDGIHLGHQQLIHRLRQTAARQQKKSMIITFEPLPTEYFTPEKAPARLTTLREKLGYLANLGVDHVLCLPFNANLAHLPATNFIDELLVKQLHIASLLIGDDFRFGRDRQGDVPLLTEYAKKNQFDLTVIEKIQQSQITISSTGIRQALATSDFVQVEKWLGRPYAIEGRVAQGQKLARTLGFPTANLPLRRLNPPICGVFAVEVKGEGLGSTPLPGVANLGKRPTVNGTQPILEVHLFDFDDTIYGRHLRVIPRQKIRDEKKMADLSALAVQISEDVALAKQFFNRN